MTADHNSTAHLVACLVLDLITSNSQLFHVTLLSLSFTVSLSTMLKLLVLFSLAMNLGGSALIDIDVDTTYDSDDNNIVYLPPKTGREFPCSVALSWFVVDEVVNRIRFPGRTTITLRGDLQYRHLKSLYEWKNLSEEDFLEGALPDLDRLLRLAIARYSDAAPLQDILAMFEAEGGDEFRRDYCRTLYHSLQQVPDSVLCKQYQWK